MIPVASGGLIGCSIKMTLISFKPTCSVSFLLNRSNEIVFILLVPVGTSIREQPDLIPAAVFSLGDERLCASCRTSSRASW